MGTDDTVGTKKGKSGQEPYFEGNFYGRPREEICPNFHILKIEHTGETEIKTGQVSYFEKYFIRGKRGRSIVVSQVFGEYFLQYKSGYDVSWPNFTNILYRRN